MRYITSAFSLSMIREAQATLKVERVGPAVFCQEAKNAVSAIGHPATAQVLSQICGFPISANRVMITLSPGDEVLVFQLLVRLEEGKVLSVGEVEELVRQGKVAFYRVKVE
mgnify:FL=1